MIKFNNDILRADLIRYMRTMQCSMAVLAYKIGVSRFTLYRIINRTVNGKISIGLLYKFANYLGKDIKRYQVHRLNRWTRLSEDIYNHIGTNQSSLHEFSKDCNVNINYLRNFLNGVDSLNGRDTLKIRNYLEGQVLAGTI